MSESRAVGLVFRRPLPQSLQVRHHRQVKNHIARMPVVGCQVIPVRHTVFAVKASFTRQPWLGRGEGSPSYRRAD